jgi:hypothetical protein
MKGEGIAPESRLKAYSPLVTTLYTYENKKKKKSRSKTMNRWLANLVGG